MGFLTKYELRPRQSRPTLEDVLLNRYPRPAQKVRRIIVKAVTIFEDALVTTRENVERHEGKTIDRKRMAEI
jgi:hypothetical protein